MAGISPAALGALLNGDIENFVVASTPGGIEAQEKRGQEAFVASEVIPRDLLGRGQDFEAMGFRFGDSVDDLFVQCQLPEGWKKELSEHPVWSYIVDERGRKRVAVFYKAAFYDTHAHATLCYRFLIDGLRTEQGKWVYCVSDCEKPVYIPPSEMHDDDDACYTDCKDWLDRHYPNWHNPLAYWEDPVT